jgi:TP901 family phage tail tape measure protein
LRQYGISLRDANGQFRDTGEILKELSDKWKTYEATQKSELATTISGEKANA